MIIRNAELETVCGITSRIPEHELPEIAFAGKSNVGKSSLINALMNRKSLARTSSQPGKTQTINFYNINHFMYLVDLPGYGFTKAPESERIKWGRMVENYLHVSKQLKAVFLLADIRHKPSANDKQMYEWVLHQGYRPVIIATKSDKLKRSQVCRCVKDVREGLGMHDEDILIPFSAETKQGREEIWQLMDKLTGWEEPVKEEKAAGKKSRKETEKELQRKLQKEAENEPLKETENEFRKEDENDSQKETENEFQKEAENEFRKETEKEPEKEAERKPRRKVQKKTQKKSRKKVQKKTQKKAKKVRA